MNENPDDHWRDWVADIHSGCGDDGIAFLHTIDAVVRWGMARKIIPNSTPQAQCLKAVSEMGELADALLKGDFIAARDAVGDVTVCLILLCELANLDFKECLDWAYDEIKDRTGTLTKEGVFVKSGETDDD